MTRPDVFTLQASDGLQIAVTNAGAAWTSCLVPVKGTDREVLLGYQTPADYLTQPGYLGAIVGRYANRIAGASFDLDGQRFSLKANEGEHQLHGGAGGFHRKLWDVSGHTHDTLELTLTSPDGDQGFPGELTVRATYRVEPPFTVTHHAGGDDDGADAVQPQQPRLLQSRWRRGRHSWPITACRSRPNRYMPVRAGPDPDRRTGRRRRHALRLPRAAPHRPSPGRIEGRRLPALLATTTAGWAMQARRCNPATRPAHPGTSQRPPLACSSMPVNSCRAPPTARAGPTPPTPAWLSSRKPCPTAPTTPSGRRSNAVLRPGDTYRHQR